MSIDTAEDVAVPLPVLNTEINVMCNPPFPIPLHVRTDCKNCAKRMDELQRMAKVNRMLKQQLKMNNHRSRHIRNLKQRKAKIESNFRSKIRDIKLQVKKTAKVRNSQVAHISSLLKYFNKYKKLLYVHKGCKITQRRLQSKITDLEKMIQSIELSNEELLYQLSASNIIKTRKDSKTYSTAFRKAIYY